MNMGRETTTGTTTAPTTIQLSNNTHHDNPTAATASLCSACSSDGIRQPKAEGRFFAFLFQSL
jgi:hypothetical protein